MRLFDAGPVLLALGEASCVPLVCSAAGPTSAMLHYAVDGWLTSILAAIATTWSALAASISHAHAHAPALVLGLAALLTIPPLAIFGHILSSRRARGEQARRLAQLAPVTDIDDIGDDTVAEAVEPAPTAVAVVDPVSARTRPGDGMTWPVDAWLKVDGGHDAPVPIVREIVRIGREDDNDIVLPLSTVHRYHAVVQRTEEAEIVVLDLSGEEGNGVLVNDKRVSRQRLRNGDRISIGHATLTFSAKRI